MVKKKTTQKKTVKKVREQKKESSKALWGVWAIVLILVIAIICIIGFTMSRESADNERRTGGPMYGIEIAANGENKYLLHGTRTDMIYINNGDEYEVEKFLIDFEAKKIWLLIDAYDKDGVIEAENMYSTEREITDAEVAEIKNVFKEIKDNEGKYCEPVADVHPYVLDDGERELEIYDSEMIDRLETMMGL